MSKFEDVWLLLWNAEHLPGADVIQVDDVVGLGDGPHADPIAQCDTVQVLSRDDGVIPAAGGRGLVAVELGRADPAGRQRARHVGDSQDVPGVDEAGVDYAVLGGDGVRVHPVGPPNAIERFPGPHGVVAEDVTRRRGGGCSRRCGRCGRGGGGAAG